MLPRMYWVVVACVCQVLALAGAIYALIEWDGTNVNGWLMGTLLTVGLPAALCLFAVAMLVPTRTPARNRIGP